MQVIYSSFLATVHWFQREKALISLHYLKFKKKKKTSNSFYNSRLSTFALVVVIVSLTYITFTLIWKLIFNWLVDCKLSPL